MSEIDQATNTDPRTCTCHPSDSPPDPCQEKFSLTECRVAALVAAMWQLLDDMDQDGLFVSLEAKAHARIAFEPFQDLDAPTPMNLEEAKRIVAASNR